MSLRIELYEKLLTDYPIDWEQWAKEIQIFLSSLKEWNERVNLVSRKDLDNDCISHIEDSLSLIPYIYENKDMDTHVKIWLDIGSGGGFPAIPVLLAQKDTPAILIERKSKKTGFLQILIAKLKLAQTKVICDTFPQCMKRIPLQKEDVGIITARGIEKPEEFAMHLQGWLYKGTRYLCQSPVVHELFNETHFIVQGIKDVFNLHGLRRGTLYIIQQKITI